MWPELPEMVVAPDDIALTSIGFVAPVAALYRTTTLASA